ncbi:hypothetical protein [Paenibacillus sp. Leaf72]|uniref:hypothetical protein n=1 Tax=Paenibacillus sp. Leaf72 TaxID=1736234 RepID=UPI0006F42D48|nr:hypothetical protein [Paenibacillus sp. Leaf72]KQO04820.1 hypothetical protein ASF12_33095 [Paenibacillus sp. Leaf72]
MHLEKAILKINNINWKLVGEVNEKGDLGYEYLRRLAQFFKEKQLKPRQPSFSNLAKLLGDEDEMEISIFCNSDVIEFFNRDASMKSVIEWYLQLARYADKHPDVSPYLCVYEPLIRVLERGGSFYMNNVGLEVKNEGYYPLNNWFEKFVNKEPIEISDL